MEVVSLSYVINHDMRNVPVELTESFSLFSLNTRASKVYHKAANGKRSRLHEYITDCGIFFILESKAALIYLTFSRCIQLVRLSELYVHDPFPRGGKLRVDSCSTSVDGKYIYSRRGDNSLQISMRGNIRSGISMELVKFTGNSPRIVPVTSGVFAWTDGFVNCRILI